MYICIYTYICTLLSRFITPISPCFRLAPSDSLSHTPDFTLLRSVAPTIIDEIGRGPGGRGGSVPLPRATEDLLGSSGLTLTLPQAGTEGKRSGDWSGGGRGVDTKGSIASCTITIAPRASVFCAASRPAQVRETRASSVAECRESSSLAGEGRERRALARVVRRVVKSTRDCGSGGKEKKKKKRDACHREEATYSLSSFPRVFIFLARGVKGIVAIVIDTRHGCRDPRDNSC